MCQEEARPDTAIPREVTATGRRRASAESRQKNRRKHAQAWYRPSCCLCRSPRSCAVRGGRLLGAIEKMAMNPYRAGQKFKERSQWALKDPHIREYLTQLFPDAIAADEVRRPIVFYTSTCNDVRVDV